MSNANKLARYADVVHALHENSTEEPIVHACLEWLDEFGINLPPLCSLDLSSNAIN